MEPTVVGLLGRYVTSPELDYRWAVPKRNDLKADKVNGQDAPLLLKVNAVGTLSTDDTVAKVTHAPGSGRYDFDFVNRAVVGCVLQATVVNGPDGGEVAGYPNSAAPSRFTVLTTRDGESFAKRCDRAFDLVLYC